MIGSILRSVGAVLLGLFVAAMIFFGVEVFANIVHPFPPGADLEDVEVIKAQVVSYPAWVLAVAAALWALMPLLGSWVATRIGTRRHFAHGLLVGLILLGLLICNLSMLPYPSWFRIANLVTFPLGILLGTWLGASARAGDGKPAMAS